VLGTQAAFSSPVKYALLPQHLATAELVDGNALMEAGTFLSILAGTIAGGLALATAWGPAACCVLLLGCAAFGLAASLRVPLLALAPAPKFAGQLEPAAATAGICARRQRREVRDPGLLVLAGRAVSLSQLSFAADSRRGQQRRGFVPAAFSIGLGSPSVWTLDEAGRSTSVKRRRPRSA
jgi:hypothetical protein